MRVSLVLLRGRANWKGPYFTSFPNIQEHIRHNTPIQTQARSCTILPNFVGLKFLIHNGKTYTQIHVTPEMVGHKLGEFAATRKAFKFKQTANK